MNVPSGISLSKLKDEFVNFCDEKKSRRHHRSIQRESLDMAERNHPLHNDNKALGGVNGDR